MHEKIDLCAELPKAKVKSDKLHLSNTMLIAEIEEKQHRIGMADRKMHDVTEERT